MASAEANQGGFDSDEDDNDDVPSLSSRACATSESDKQRSKLCDPQLLLSYEKQDGVLWEQCTKGAEKLRSDLKAAAARRVQADESETERLYPPEITAEDVHERKQLYGRLQNNYRDASNNCSTIASEVSLREEVMIVLENVVATVAGEVSGMETRGRFIGTLLKDEEEQEDEQANQMYELQDDGTWSLLTKRDPDNFDDLDEFSQPPYSTAVVIDPFAEGEVFACICHNPRYDPNDLQTQMMTCDECDEWHHVTCVGLQEVPDAWYCSSCEEKKRPATQPASASKAYGEDHEIVTMGKRKADPPARGNKRRMEPTSIAQVAQAGSAVEICRIATDEGPGNKDGAAASWCKVCKNTQDPRRAQDKDWRKKMGEERCRRCGSYWLRHDKEWSPQVQWGGAR